jgi:hypothetical protein
MMPDSLREGDSTGHQPVVVRRQSVQSSAVSSARCLTRDAGESIRTKMVPVRMNGRRAGAFALAVAAGP